MVVAPAVGIACCQVLAALCGLVAGLFVILGAKNWLLGGEGLAPGLALLSAAAFVAGALACLWFARVVRRLTQGQ